MGSPVIPYVQQSWTDGASQCNAARNGVHEDGIRDAHYMPAVRAYHNANQSITNSTQTILAFNSERFDQVGNVASTMHDNSTNNSRLTCLYAGVYQITANVDWAPNGTGDRGVQIYLNGATIIGREHLPDASAANTCTQVVTTLYPLAVNDYVETRVWQNSGGALNVLSTANLSPEFMMVRVA